MSYTLGSATLPRPTRMRRRQVEKSSANTTIDGTIKRDVAAQKEQFILEYTMLTQAEVSNILGEYNLKTKRSFAVAETNLTIGPVDVHINIREREYNTKGVEYREDLELVLTEV